MLLGIPGDNTYSNYQEAQRAFWRQTVLPLVNRTATALANWLAPGFIPGSVDPYGSSGQIAERGPPDALNLIPDLDQVEALSSEREALWARLERTTFLTADEKRAAVGYGPLSLGASPAGGLPSGRDSPCGRAGRERRALLTLRCLTSGQTPSAPLLQA